MIVYSVLCDNKKGHLGRNDRNNGIKTTFLVIFQCLLELAKRASVTGNSSVLDLASLVSVDNGIHLLSILYELLI